MSQIGKISKFVIGVSGAVTTSFLAVYPSSAHWLPAVVAGVTAVLVYAVPNVGGTKPPTTPPTV